VGILTLARRFLRRRVAMSGVYQNRTLPHGVVQNLEQCLANIAWEDSSYYPALVAVLQAISTIRKGRKQRDVHKEDSRGAKLKGLEDSIANLDNLQGRAVIETVDGVQRIRGLAGSGKTIVLASRRPTCMPTSDWKIAVTFNTIAQGTIQTTHQPLVSTNQRRTDWDNVQIIHAWELRWRRPSWPLLCVLPNAWTGIP
jgi:superfamily I DNA and RNA helicase